VRICACEGLAGDRCIRGRDGCWAKARLLCLHAAPCLRTIMQGGPTYFARCPLPPQSQASLWPEALAPLAQRGKALLLLSGADRPTPCTSMQVCSALSTHLHCLPTAWRKHTCKHTHAHVHAHAQAHAHADAHARTHTHPQTHTRTHTHMHTCTHAHTHAHMEHAGRDELLPTAMLASWATRCLPGAHVRLLPRLRHADILISGPAQVRLP